MFISDCKIYFYIIIIKNMLSSASNNVVKSYIIHGTAVISVANISWKTSTRGKTNDCFQLVYIGSRSYP